MELSFLPKCFLIGILAASGCGPIFVLTFNRSAVCGFWKGFMTALGASLGDAFYFSLGLAGALAVISELKYFMVFLDLIGGLVLLLLGVHALKKMQKMICVTVECSFSPVLSLTKAFSLTVLNPIVILFFLAISIQALPEGVSYISYWDIFLSSLAVCAGSLLVLSSVSLFASFVGACITAKRLRTITGISGLTFIGFGVYLLSDFIIQWVRLLT